MSAYCFKRGEYYYYRRRIPEFISHLDERSEILLSLKTKDKKEGLRKAGIYNDFIEEYWRKLLTLEGKLDKKAEYKLAIKRAKIHGFTYKTAIEVAKSSVQEIVDRISEAKSHGDDIEVVSSVLGGEDKPEILLSECFDKYFPLCSDRLVNKSDNQIRQWKNPRILAINTFIDIISDKPISKVTRADVLNFKQYWLDSVADGNCVANTANKRIFSVRDILKVISNSYDLGINVDLIFADTKLKQVHNSRPSFENSYVQNTYLRGSKLLGLNKEARLLIYAMCDTGARISELIGLREEDIFLEGQIPHIWIRPYEKHSLKTAHSERKIPLVGASFYAFQELRVGFKHYTNPATASSTVNKFLRENDLKPSPKHQLYSLRHTFKDRLRDSGAPEEVIDELMGHKKAGPKYGRGHLLETKYDWLRKIAFDASHLY